MKQKMRRLSVILLAFVVTLTTIPAAGGMLDVHAASGVKGFKVYAAGSSNVDLHWGKLTKKQRKKVTGITVFRNGEAVKNLSKKSTSYADSGLAAGTVYSYQIKLYKKKIKKFRMWRNKKTGELQKKKPSRKQKKNFKRVTIKKTTYTYSDASTVRRIRTAGVKDLTPSSSSDPETSSSGGDNSGSSGGGGSSGGDTGTTPGDNAAQWFKNATAEDASTYIEFGSVRVHKGQTWNSSLYNQLASRANGVWSCTDSTGYFNRYSASTYIFNTNTYAPFLCIYVADNKVVGFHSNAEVLFTYKGKALLRNQSREYYGDNVYNFHPNSDYGVLVAGIASPGGRTDAEHRTVGFHFINAARVAAGLPILKRSYYLEGVYANGSNMTWSGTISEGNDTYDLDLDDDGNVVRTLKVKCSGYSLSNQRFGAQAWAETMAASNKCAHSGLNEGVLGMNNAPDFIKNADAEDRFKVSAWQDTVRRIVVWYASSKSVSPLGENAGVGSGEYTIYSYSNHALHVGAIMDPDYKSVGVGYNGGYHCEDFAKTVEN